MKDLLAPEALSDGKRDEAAVRHFAQAMIDKMHAGRVKKGRKNWHTISVAELWNMLREHVEKGDPVDVANFAMMIYHNSNT